MGPMGHPIGKEQVVNSTVLNRKRLFLTISLLAAAVLPGCNSAGEGAFSGATIGALAGMGIGSLSGDMGKGAAAGAIGGAILGGILGDQNSRR